MPPICNGVLQDYLHDKVLSYSKVIKESLRLPIERYMEQSIFDKEEPEVKYVHASDPWTSHYI